MPGDALMAQLDIRLTIGPRGVGVLAAVAILGALVAQVSSESLNLSTFYPSPAGIYNTLKTTGQTFLARDARGVTVGSTQGVQNNGATGLQARLVVPTGSVGIGTLNPSSNLHVEGSITFGDVSVDRVSGIDWTGGTNGTGLWYGINRERGTWTGMPYASLKVDFHTGLKLKGFSGYGGVSIYDDYCETGQDSCGGGGSGAGTEIARFRVNSVPGWGTYGSYISSRLGLGGVASPVASVDVGGEGIVVLQQPGATCYVPLDGTCTGNTYGLVTSTRGGSGWSRLCCRCPYNSCAGLP
jgi:hypothetical protein